jgi:hypothetical protein
MNVGKCDDRTFSNSLSHTLSAAAVESDVMMGAQNELNGE